MMVDFDITPQKLPRLRHPGVTVITGHTNSPYSDGDGWVDYESRFSHYECDKVGTMCYLPSNAEMTGFNMEVMPRNVCSHAPLDISILGGFSGVIHTLFSHNSFPQARHFVTRVEEPINGLGICSVFHSLNPEAPVFVPTSIESATKFEATNFSTELYKMMMDQA
jgi:hypothetical protein